MIMSASSLVGADKKMNLFNFFRSYVAVLLSAVSLGAAPMTSAQPCADVQVVFARGTGEDPGLGPTGQAFADALGARLGGRPMDVYPINYPASDQWSTGESHNLARLYWQRKASVAALNSRSACSASLASVCH
jgi:hypothetical protein